MSVDTQPLALSFGSPTEFIHSILRRQVRTVLVVCLSREDFVKELQIPCSNEHGEDTSDNFYVSPGLQYPTIQLIAASQNVKLVYTPSLAHLRAYLSAFECTDEESINPSSQPCVLTLVMALNLHRSTGNFSAQGISRTVSLAVSTAKYASLHLNIVEFTLSESIRPLAGDGNEGNTNWDPWRESIPLLNGSLRHRPGERSFAGRTVEVGSVVEKWCKVVYMDDMLVQ